MVKLRKNAGYIATRVLELLGHEFLASTLCMCKFVILKPQTFNSHPVWLVVWPEGSVVLWGREAEG